MRRILVRGVDLGDHVPRSCWLEVGPAGAVVRRFYGRKRFGLSLRQAAEAIARRAQVLAWEKRMGVE